jgi:hypothetical protein
MVLSTAFHALFQAATVSNLEDVMLTTYNSYTIYLCVFLHLVQHKFLPITLPCGAKIPTLSLYLDFMKAKSFAPLTHVSNEWATRYASGGEVYHDLMDNDISPSDLPTNFKQLRQLTPVVRNQRHVVWSEVLRKSKGRPTAIATMHAASGAPRIRVQKRSCTFPTPQRPTHFVGGTIVEGPARGTRATADRTVEHNREGPLDVLNGQERPTPLVIFSCTSVRYGTPPYLVHPSRETLGGTIDLDPFSEARFDAVVRARKIYTKDQDGMRRSNAWAGRVFMNPPGGTKNGHSMSGLALARAIEEYNAGNVTACVAIVKAAVGYVWFKQAWQFPMCFLHERPAFRAFDAESDAAGDDSRAPTGYVVVYMGKEVAKFHHAFKGLGHFVLPAREFINISQGTST